MARRYRGQVNFLSINVRDDRDEARRIVTERGWELPVGYDADGAVSNLYRVGVCPTVAFAYPGGILARRRIGSEELTRGDDGGGGEAADRGVRAPGRDRPMTEAPPRGRLGGAGAGRRAARPRVALRRRRAWLGAQPREVKQRLRELANRFSGAQAINLRHQPIPWAYRVFYRHIGLDPDEQPTPVEEMVLERMRRGGFPSSNLLDDALTIATVESGVALRAFDADRVEGRPGIRASEPGESLEGRPGELPTGTLVIADEARPLGLLFGATATGRGVAPRTKRTMLCAIQVKGVPEIAVEEAIWLASGVLQG